MKIIWLVNKNSNSNSTAMTRNRSVDDARSQKVSELSRSIFVKYSTFSDSRADCADEAVTVPAVAAAVAAVAAVVVAAVAAVANSTGSEAELTGSTTIGCGAGDTDMDGADGALDVLMGGGGVVLVDPDSTADVVLTDGKRSRNEDMRHCY